MHTTRIFAGLLVCGLLIGCGSSNDPDATGSGPGSGSGAGTTTAQGGNGPGSGGSSTTGPGGGGAPSFNGYTRVDTAGNAVDQSADVVVAPDGTIYVSWVDGGGKVRVSRSTDGGASFEAAAQLDLGSIVPLVSMARHPRLAADNSRVAVALSDEQGNVPNYLCVSSSSGPLSFGQCIPIGTDVSTIYRDFPKPVFLPDGSIAVSWHATASTPPRIFLARENANYASAPASGGAPGVPCECCPNEVFKTDGGDLMVAFRNNDSNTREMWLAQAPQSGAFSSWVQASTTEGIVPNCPMQGPRIARMGNAHAMVWSSRGGNTAGAAVMSMSSNGGASWSGGAPISGLMGDEPTIAVSASGRTYVTAVTGNQRSSMTWSDDGGATWSSAENLAAPDGDLSTPQAYGEAGMAVLAGVSQASTVWLLRME